MQFKVIWSQIAGNSIQFDSVFINLNYCWIVFIRTSCRRFCRRMSNPLMLRFRRVAFQFLQSKRQRISSSLILSCISDTLLPDFQRQASRSLHCNQCIYIHKSAFNSPFDVIPACRESDFYQSQMLPGLDPPVPPKGTAGKQAGG